LDEVESAMRIVYAHTAPSPQYCWPILSQMLGCELWVKHENHSPIGCFKLRGGLTYLSHLKDNVLASRGIVAPTRGNHGQSIAYASRIYGISATIVVPFGNDAEKNSAMRAHGARLIEHGDDYQAAREYALELEEHEGKHMVRSFTPQLLRGVATYPLELLRGVRDLDAVYIQIGMGSGVSAMLLVRDLLALGTDVIGVVADGAPSYALSFEQGKAVSTATAETVADGLACRSPDPGVVDLLHRRAARVVRVTDQEIMHAVALYMKTTHNLIEPAGAASLAALWKERETMRGKKVAVIATGGNLDTSLLPEVLKYL
jgi:threonine dehydratase